MEGMGGGDGVGGGSGTTGPATRSGGDQGRNGKETAWDGRFRVVRGRGRSGAIRLEAMTAVPNKVFRLRRTHMRLEQAEAAIETYASQAALDNHHVAKAGFYELIACAFRHLDREDVAKRYEEKRDAYVKMAEKRMAAGRRRPRRKTVNPDESPSTTKAKQQSKRETPVSQPVVQESRKKGK